MDRSAGFDVEHIPMMVAGDVGMDWASTGKKDERIHDPRRMPGEHIGLGTSKYTDHDAALVVGGHARIDL